MDLAQLLKEEPKQADWQPGLSKHGSFLWAMTGANLISAPFQRLKLVKQVRPLYPASQFYKVQSLRKSSGIVKQFGVASLWNGNFINTVRMAIYYLTADVVVPADKPHLSLLVGLLATFLTQPLEAVRLRMTACPSPKYEPLFYKGIFDCFKKTIVHEGFTALYRAFPLNALYHGLLTGGSLYFANNKEVRNVLGEFDSCLQLIASSVVVGLTLHPLDTLRKLRALDGSLTLARVYRGTRTTVAGVGAGLWRGAEWGLCRHGVWGYWLWTFNQFLREAIDGQ